MVRPTSARELKNPPPSGGILQRWFEDAVSDPESTFRRFAPGSHCRPAQSISRSDAGDIGDGKVGGADDGSTPTNAAVNFAFVGEGVDTCACAKLHTGAQSSPSKFKI